MQLLPNAKSQFIDSAGQPLANGTVGFYSPGTLNPKATYQDSAGTIANTNPVQLDSRGQALIWGSGVYRQILKDASGVTIWDQLTEDPNSGLTGNITDAKFVAGTDFTPGTTTSLTLPVAPGASTNLWTFFDAAYQADDQVLSLVGTTLTFVSPIPVGVQEVNIKIGTTVAAGIPSSGSVTDATVAAGAGIDSSKLSFLQAGAGAVRRTVQSKLRDVFSVMDFGAKGDGATDDTAAINTADLAATNANAALYFPQGTYMVSNAGVTRNGASWFGEGQDSSIVKALAQSWTTAKPYLVSATGLSFLDTSELGFDVSLAIFPPGAGNPGNIYSIFQLITCNNWIVSHCAFTGIQGHTIGLAVNGGSQWSIDKNYFNMPSPTGASLNQAVNISASAALVQNYRVTDNVMVGSALDSSGNLGFISGNYITGYRFGAGITIGGGPVVGRQDSLMNTVVGNICTLGAGQDVNVTYPAGCENWGAYNIFKGNIFASNSGHGISSGNVSNIIDSNICFNNGQLNGSGIVLYSLNGAQSQECMVTNNLCFDNQATKTQQYGFVSNLQVGALDHNTYANNNFNGNKLGTMMVQDSGYMSFRGPQLFQQNSFGGATIANGSSSFAGYAFNGAQLGDHVKVALSESHQNCIVSGYVDAANHVSAVITNSTGGSVTLAASNINFWVEKPASYADLG